MRIENGAITQIVRRHFRKSAIFKHYPPTCGSAMRARCVMHPFQLFLHDMKLLEQQRILFLQRRDSSIGRRLLRLLLR
ncbi:hypothetical protein AKG08_09165 [Achromobacter piechaudii]|nr:hypothetical protein AKG08_09165 [Achromobacter piechaudii]